MELLGVDGFPQNFAHFAHQGIRSERLVEECGLGAWNAAAYYRIVRVARHVDYFHIRFYWREPFGELASAHVGHDDVGQHQVNRIGVLLADQQRLSAVASFEDFIALAGQQLGSQIANSLFILDQEDGLESAKRFYWKAEILDGRAPFIGFGEKYLERRALADFAAD